MHSSTVLLFAILLLFTAWTCTVQPRFTVEWARSAPTSVPLSNVTMRSNALVSSFKVVVASDGSSYVCGTLRGNVTFGQLTSDQVSASHLTAFVAKYSNSGIELWVNLLTASSNSYCLALALVSDGLYVGGAFVGNLTEPSLLNATSVTGTTVRGFFGKYSANGTAEFLQVLGADQNVTTVATMSSDGSDNVYLGGNFNGNLSLGNFSLTPMGNLDVYLAKFSNTNETFLWANQIGGVNATTRAFSVATNSIGYGCFTGTFTGLVSFHNSSTTTATNSAAAPPTNNIGLFVEQFNTNGSMIWLNTAYANDTHPNSIQIDSNQVCTLVGSFRNILNFPPFDPIQVRNQAAFFAKFRSNGTLAILQTTDGQRLDDFEDVTCRNITGVCWVASSFNRRMTLGRTTYLSPFRTQGLVLKFDIDGHVLDRFLPTLGQTQSTAISHWGTNVWYTGFYNEVVGLGGFTLASPAIRSLFLTKICEDGVC